MGDRVHGTCEQVRYLAISQVAIMQEGRRWVAWRRLEGTLFATSMDQFQDVEVTQSGAPSRLIKV